jgi:hypothetical protein
VLFHDLDIEPSYCCIFLSGEEGAWDTFFLGLSDGCVFSDGRKYLSVAMCVRFFGSLHFFAYVRYFFYFFGVSQR